GSAIFAAVAAGSAAGGYDDVFAAARAMGKVKELVYQPIPENAKIYNQLFDEYRTLHDYLGRGANDVMKRIKAIKIGQ
ncbi:MAG: ribulokinase, partial [Clostridia bacterium]